MIGRVQVDDLGCARASVNAWQWQWLPYRRCVGLLVRGTARWTSGLVRLRTPHNDKGSTAGRDSNWTQQVGRGEGAWVEQVHTIQQLTTAPIMTAGDLSRSGRLLCTCTAHH